MRAIFERLVTPERTRAVVSLAELRELPGDPDDIERLVHRLVDARLLVIEARAGDDRAVELVHESLIERWPTLVGWLDENRDDAAFLARLRTAAAQWQASDHDEGVLWRDEPARRALAWLAHYRGELGRRERAYLDAVHAVATRAERRRRLVRRRVVAAVVVVPMILLAVAGVALVRISRAEREASGQRDELERRRSSCASRPSSCARAATSCRSRSARTASCWRRPAGRRRKPRPSATTRAASRRKPSARAIRPPPRRSASRRPTPSERHEGPGGSQEGRPRRREPPRRRAGRRPRRPSAPGRASRTRS